MTSKNEENTERLPPGQAPIKDLLRWGIDHPGITRSNPKIDLKTYTLEIGGEVEKPAKLSWNQVLELPRVESTSDFHCADGYTTSLTLDEVSGDDVLLAYRLNGEPLEEGTGFPLRLVVPSKYGYKSALWVVRIRFTVEKELGFWEKRGYSDSADVWSNDRFSK